MLPKDGKTFLCLLNERKKQLHTSLATASVITWLFADTVGLETQIFNCVYMEGSVHASAPIRLELSRRVLPENLMTAKSYKRLLKLCSLAQAIPTYSIPLSKYFLMKIRWIRLPSISESGRIIVERAQTNYRSY